MSCFLTGRTISRVRRSTDLQFPHATALFLSNRLQRDARRFRVSCIIVLWATCIVQNLCRRQHASRNHLVFLRTIEYDNLWNKQSPFYMVLLRNLIPWSSVRAEGTMNCSYIPIRLPINKHSGTVGCSEWRWSSSFTPAGFKNAQTSK